MPFHEPNATQLNALQPSGAFQANAPGFAGAAGAQGAAGDPDISSVMSMLSPQQGAPQFDEQTGMGTADPADFQANKAAWLQIVDRLAKDKGLQAQMLEMGVRLMQPVPAGQTPFGHLGKAILGGAQARTAAEEKTAAGRVAGQKEKREEEKFDLEKQKFSLEKKKTIIDYIQDERDFAETKGQNVLRYSLKELAGKPKEFKEFVEEVGTVEERTGIRSVPTTTVNAWLKRNTPLVTIRQEPATRVAREKVKERRLQAKMLLDARAKWIKNQKGGERQQLLTSLQAGTTEQKAALATEAANVEVQADEIFGTMEEILGQRPKSLAQQKPLGGTPTPPRPVGVPEDAKWDEGLQAWTLTRGGETRAFRTQ